MVYVKRWYPNIWQMTIFTYFGRKNVVRSLARRFNAVVAIDTISNDIYVVEIGRQPPNR